MVSQKLKLMFNHVNIHSLYLVIYSYYVSCVIFQGEEGVREVLQILNDEFRLSMALSGEGC